METFAVIALVACVILTFNFVFLSFQSGDESLRKQLMSFAVSTLITGGVIMACLVFYIGIRKALQGKMEYAPSQASGEESSVENPDSEDPDVVAQEAE